MGAVKGIPYGMSNFTDVIEQNRYYVDKTMYIPMLEDQANYLIFIRPRRFGKSLLLSMLRAYYDLSSKDKFQQLFGNLWIGQQPTPLQGTYQILYLDFSKIGGNIDELPQRFDSYSAVQLDGFLNRYRDYYTDEFISRFSVPKKVLTNCIYWMQRHAVWAIPYTLLLMNTTTLPILYSMNKETKFIMTLHMPADSTGMLSRIIKECSTVSL